MPHVTRTTPPPAGSAAIAAWKLPQAAGSLYASGAAEPTQVPPFASTHAFALAFVAAAIVHGAEALADIVPELAVTTKVCGPSPSPLYVVEPEQATGAAPSSAHETVAALALVNVNAAVVSVVEADGPEVILTVGALGPPSDETVHVASAWPEPAGLTSRMASVCVPALRPVSVSGEEHANAGALLSRAHVAASAGCDVHAIVAVVAEVGDGGCDVIAMVGAPVVATRLRGAVPAAAAGLPTSAARIRRRRRRNGMFWIGTGTPDSELALVGAGSIEPVGTRSSAPLRGTTHSVRVVGAVTGRGVRD